MYKPHCHNVIPAHLLTFYSVKEKKSNMLMCGNHARVLYQSYVTWRLLEPRDSWKSTEKSTLAAVATRTLTTWGQLQLERKMTCVWITDELACAFFSFIHSFIHSEWQLFLTSLWVSELKVPLILSIDSSASQEQSRGRRNYFMTWSNFRASHDEH